MDREIKFRAESNLGGLVYGHYHMIKYHAYSNDGMLITEDEHVISWFHHGRYMSEHVKAETIGQYTGIKDKNGTEIYEGDILSWFDGYNSTIEKVIFRDGQFLSFSKTGGASLIRPRDTGGATTENFKVIGNMHESPELLDA